MRQILKDILKDDFFHGAINNPALISLREGTHYEGFNTSYFGAWVSFRLLVTRLGSEETPFHSVNNGNLEPSKADVYTT